MNLAAVRNFVHSRSRSQDTIASYHLHVGTPTFDATKDGVEQALPRPSQRVLELPPALPVFRLNQRRWVLSTSLPRTIKCESKRPLVHREVTATIARHGVLHFTPSLHSFFSRPVVHSTGKFPFQFTGTSSPADDAPQERPFLLRDRNGYLSLSIFRQNPCSLRTITWTISSSLDCLQKEHTFHF